MYVFALQFVEKTSKEKTKFKETSKLDETTCSRLL